MDAYTGVFRYPGMPIENAERSMSRPLGSFVRWGQGDRTYKLASGTTSEPGRYVKSLGEPRDGILSLGDAGKFPIRKPMGTTCALLTS